MSTMIEIQKGRYRYRSAWSASIAVVLLLVLAMLATALTPGPAEAQVPLDESGIATTSGDVLCRNSNQARESRSAVNVVLLTGFINIDSGLGGIDLSGDCGGSDDDASSIIFGDPVAAPAPAWMAAITADTGTCGGVLVAPTLVLTAAHCNGNLTSVRLGSTEFNSGGLDLVPVAGGTEVHPWNDGPSNTHDLMLIELPVSTLTQADVAPLIDYDEAEPGSGLFLGYSNAGFQQSLNSATFPFTNLQVGSNPDFESRRFFSAPGGAAMCRGDSGGPVFTADGTALASIFVGISEPVPGVPNCSHSGFVVSLLNFGVRDWLIENIYDSSSQSMLDEMLYAGQTPPQTPQYIAMPTYADDPTSQWVADALAWKELRHNKYNDPDIAPVNASAWLANSPSLASCAGSPAAQVNTLELTAFADGSGSVDPGGIWHCEETSPTSDLELYLSAAWAMKRWGTPVVVESAAGVDIVLRRLDFNIVGTTNDPNALVNVCGWNLGDTIPATQAAAMCPSAGIELHRVVYRELNGLESVFEMHNRLCGAEFDTQINPKPTIVWDPPSADAATLATMMSRAAEPLARSTKPAPAGMSTKGAAVATTAPTSFAANC